MNMVKLLSKKTSTKPATISTIWLKFCLIVDMLFTSLSGGFVDESNSRVYRFW